MDLLDADHEHKSVSSYKTQAKFYAQQDPLYVAAAGNVPDNTTGTIIASLNAAIANCRYTANSQNLRQEEALNIYNLKADNIFFGKSQDLPKVGINVSSIADANNGYQFAYHIKSFIIGQWSNKFFPLQFINQLLLTLHTELSSNCIRNTTFLTATGVIDGTSNTAIWSYNLQDIVLHYDARFSCRKC